MGCGSSDDRKDKFSRLQDLENLLQEQEQEKSELKLKLEQIRTERKQYENDDEYGINDEYKLSNKIEQLTNEKKQVFKTMMKERKKVSNLEDKIEEYKTQINKMEQQFNILKYEKKPEPPQNTKKPEPPQNTKKPEPPQNTKKPEPPKQREQVFGKSTLHGINIPKPIADLPTNNNNNNNNGKGRIKPRITAKNDDDVDLDDESSSSEDVTTQNLDAAFDPESESVHVYSWIHGQKIDPKNKQAVSQLKQRLAGLLTARSEGYRRTLKHTYRHQNGVDLVKDIKAILVKGHTMEIINNLLMTRAQFDAILINQHVANWEIEPVADIICCRSMVQLQELHEAYKKKCKYDVKKQLQALAQKDKKKTLIKVIGGILDLKRKEDANVDMNKVNEGLNFMLKTKNFKGDSKEKLVLLFTTNSIQFVNVLNHQFKLKSKDTLVGFIDKKIGPKSTAGHFCKTRILYALDTADYYAQKIKKLGFQYKKNQKKISDIFIQRMEIDLDLIQRTWTIKYGDGKELKEWIAQKSKGTNSGLFLQKMLVNCQRYTEFHKEKKTDGGGGTQKSKFQKMMM